MKYRYRKTGTIVESAETLDSILFEEIKPIRPVKPETPSKKIDDVSGKPIVKKARKR